MASVKPETQVPGQGPSRPSTRVLFLTVFLDLLGFGIVIPFLPMFAAQLGVSSLGVGVILASYSLMQFIFAPVLGRVSDRVGRRPVIMLGLLGSCAGYLIYGLATSFLWLVLSRAIHGACAATVSTAQAYIADTTDESNRARGMGLIGAAFGLGFVFGPALGGLLGHWSLRIPGFFASALALANFIFAGIRLAESHHPAPGQRIDFALVAAPLIELPRRFVGHHLSRLFWIAFLTTSATAAFETTFSLMVPKVYGYGAAGVGALFAVAGLVQVLAQGYLFGRLVDRLGEAHTLALGIALFALGLGPLANLPSGGMLFAGLGLLSLGYGFANPAVATLISRRATMHLRGEALGLNQSALSLARIFGPIAGGFGYGALGSPAPYVGGALVAVMAFILARGTEDRSA